MAVGPDEPRFRPGPIPAGILTDSIPHGPMPTAKQSAVSKLHNGAVRPGLNPDGTRPRFPTVVADGVVKAPLFFVGDSLRFANPVLGPNHKHETSILEPGHRRL